MSYFGFKKQVKERKLIIFGVGEQAELAWWYFTQDSQYEVCAFVVDPDFLDKNKLFDLPVVSSDQLPELYSPSEFYAFVAIGYSNVNRIREDKYLFLKKLGYNLASYISSQAVVLTEDIGDNCFLLENNTLQPFVKVGNNVTIWSGNHIGHHSVIDDNCFITSHVVISGGVKINRNCFLGVNATLRDHIQIGAYSVIGASSIIMRDVENDSVYVPQRTYARETKSNELKGI